MGAWSPDPLGNDDAADLIDSVMEEGHDGPLIDAFVEVCEAEPGAYLEADTCSRAIAAAEVIARLRGAPGAEPDEDLDDWVREQEPAVAAELVAKHREAALLAIARIGADSELAELWAEGADLQVWLDGLTDLARRLG